MNEKTDRDLTRNEITSSFSSSVVGGIFENPGERTRRSAQKSGRPASPRRARNGTNFFIWIRFIWHLTFFALSDVASTADSCARVSAFRLHYLEKRKSGRSPVWTSFSAHAHTHASMRNMSRDVTLRYRWRFAKRSWITSFCTNCIRRSSKIYVEHFKPKV